MREDVEANTVEGESAKTVRALKAHLAINVRDVERSTEFYTKMLGTGPCKVRRGYAKFDVESPPLNFTLNERPFGERGALWHMGIQVASTEDVLAVRERWMRAGLPTRDEMQVVCGYALQDKTWVADPDGNQWEVFVVLRDNVDLEADSSADGTGASDACAQGPASCASAGAPAVGDACCGDV